MIKTARPRASDGARNSACLRSNRSMVALDGLVSGTIARVQQDVASRSPGAAIAQAPRRSGNPSPLEHHMDEQQSHGGEAEPLMNGQAGQPDRPEDQSGYEQGGIEKKKELVPVHVRSWRRGRGVLAFRGGWIRRLGTPPVRRPTRDGPVSCRSFTHCYGPWPAFPRKIFPAVKSTGVEGFRRHGRINREQYDAQLRVERRLPPGYSR